MVSASPVDGDQRTEDDAAAEENDCAPVDLGGVAPAQGELALLPVRRQQEEQRRAEHGHDAFVEPVADELVGA